MNWKDILISNRIKQLIMFVLFTVCLVSVCLSIIYTAAEENKKNIRIENLNSDWIYEDEEGNCRNITLPAQIKVSPDTPVSIIKRLPEEHIEAECFSLCFRSSQQDVDVYLDNKLIYHYDSHADNPFGRASFSSWHLFELPQGFEGKTLRITTTSPYSQYSGRLNTVKWGNNTDLYSSLIKAHFLPYLLSLLFIFTGLLFCSICIFGIRRNTYYQQFGELGFLILLIGLWLCSESKMPDTYMFHGFTAVLIAHNSILFMPMPLILYIKHKTTARTDVFLSALFYICIAGMVLVNFLQFTGQYDYIETLIVPQLLLMVSISSCIYCMWCYNETGLNIFEKLSLLACFLSVIVEFWWYGQGNTSYTGQAVQISIIISAALIAASEIRNLIEEAKKAVVLSERLKDKKAYIAASQMKPHFIYNALGAISTMIYTNRDDAYKAMNSFIKYLRASIGSQDLSKLIPFSQELEHIKAYCDIEHYRFGDRITVLYQLETTDFLVPPISIQPLVENAIKHGVFPKRDGGTVTIVTAHGSDGIIIRIIDDGVGFHPSEAAKDTSIGLTNLTYRLKILCDAAVEIESRINEGTTVTIRIPERSL